MKSKSEIRKDYRERNQESIQEREARKTAAHSFQGMSAWAIEQYIEQLKNERLVIRADIDVLSGADAELREEIRRAQKVLDANRRPYAKIAGRPSRTGQERQK